MELKTAIEILEYHQEWRLGNREDMIHEPKKLTEALDIVLSEVKKLPIHNVSKSVAKQYAEFCVRCDREGLPLLELDDYIKQYCC